MNIDSVAYKTDKEENTKLPMDKIPRCIVLFETACKSKRTLKTYRHTLDKFLNYCHKDPQSFIMLSSAEIEKTLQDYCMELLKRVKLEEISPNTIPSYFNGIFYFLKVNRIKYDKEAITMLFPDRKKLGGHDAITTEQLVQLINATDTKRDRALVYFFVATGARPEAVCDLQLKHITEYQDGFYKVILYSDDYKHEMITFIHAESVKFYKEWLEEREQNGERLTPESWAFGSNFFSKQKCVKLGYTVLENLFDRLWKRSGIKRVKTGNRFNLASTTSIRKRFDTVLEMNPEVSSGASQYLMDHTGYLSGRHYRRPTEEQIFRAYRSATAELMVSEEMRMELQMNKQESEMQLNDSIKDRRIKELESRAEQTEKLLMQLMKKLES